MSSFIHIADLMASESYPGIIPIEVGVRLDLTKAGGKIVYVSDTSCSGAAIDHHLLLTAGHCWNKNERIAYLRGSSPTISSTNIFNWYVAYQMWMAHALKRNPQSDTLFPGPDVAHWLRFPSLGEEISC